MENNRNKDLNHEYQASGVEDLSNDPQMNPGEKAKESTGSISQLEKPFVLSKNRLERKRKYDEVFDTDPDMP